RLQLSPATTDRKTAEHWLADRDGATDGVIAKRSDIPYASGNRYGMLKVKRIRSVDCVIGGYRVAADGTAIGSLLLGLYDANGGLDYVGFTSGVTAEEKRALLERLAPLKTTRSFSVRIPGGPSRWNRGKDAAWVPVEPQLVLEVQFDHLTAGRFRHGTRPLRFRPDKAPRQCTTAQIA
ncbi:MAG: ATP-dependent DNA ligase, partial [Candidatus Baltobacteraceae bacterium]